MNRPLQFSFIAFIGIFGFGAGAWFTSARSATAAAASARRVVYFQDPMHPSYRSDKPGTAPDCGMPLEPVYADGQTGAAPAINSPGGNKPGAVRINPDKQQLIGIRTAAVERTGGSRIERTTGRVAVDETRIYRLTSSVDGWVLRAFPKATGDRVAKGEPLLTFYSREFLGAEQAYFYSLDSLDRFQQAGPVAEKQLASIQAQIQQNKDALLTLGMGERQIADIAATRKLTQEVFLNSPAEGFIIARNVSPGLRFERGVEFYRLADLSRVWILADVYESEAPFLGGGAATVTWAGRTLRARRTGTPPQFDAVSRTERVRFEAENPGTLLRPDMFVDVELPLNMPEALTVPADAVLDSGRRKIVYVDRGSGVFEPRPVETGWRHDDRIAIIRGLGAADRVVTSGTFLLDSESRLELAASGAAAAASPAEENPALENNDPVCGMNVKSTEYSVTLGGRTLRFCSARCQRDFEAHPERYAQRSGS
jgi:membrane fusion protein, copper/silver efflux system